MKRSVLLPLLFCAACSVQEKENNETANVASPAEVPNAEPVAGPRPEATGKQAGTVENRREDRDPVPEAPFTETGAQGAANVVQTYYALLEAGKYRDAWRLWSDGGRTSGMSAEAFAASFDKYAEYHAEIGAPGATEGAAGSLYVEVPVRVYGRFKSGEAFNMEGPVTLRRVNDVPGSTEEQRRWHIASSGVRPRP